MHLTLEQLLERVLALPKADGAPRALLEAFRDGDRSQELVERMRAQFRTGGDFSAKNPPPALLALGWAAEAAMCEIGGRRFNKLRDQAIRFAKEALAEHERNQRPTERCAPPEVDAGGTHGREAEPLWTSDPAGQPAGLHTA